MEQQLRQHAITFTFAHNIKSSIINWIKQVQAVIPSFVESVARDNDSFSHETKSHADVPPIFHVEEVLETTVVHLTNVIIAKLGHPVANLRSKSATLLTQLAAILDEKFICNDPKTDQVIGLFMSDNHEDYSRVHHLFQLIGKSLNVMVIALVAGLECVNKGTDWHTRGICNTALVRLVFENDKTFQDDDNLAAIWNLFFMLGSMPQSSREIQDRIVIIKGLGLLAPLYVKVDSSLAKNIIECLVKLKIKFASEITEIKNTIKNIFEISDSKSDTANDQNQGIGFKMFLNILNSYDEASFELLGWTFEKYLTSVLPLAPDGSLKPGSTVLNDFLTALTNHYRSSSSVIRYGACLLLYTALTLNRKVLDESNQLFMFVASGMVDSDYLTTLLYLGMIDLVDDPNTAEAKKLLASHRVEASSDDFQSSIYKIIHSIVKISPPLGKKVLQKMATSLDYLPLPMKLKQLELIHAWSKKYDKADMFFLQTIAPLTKDPNPKIQSAALKIIHAVIPALRHSSDSEVTFVWSYLLTILNNDTEDAILVELLALAREYPIDMLPQAAKEEYIFSLFSLTLNANFDIRLTVYENLGLGIPLWISSNLVYLANAVFIISLGDEHIPCVKMILNFLIQKTGSYLGGAMIHLDKIQANISRRNIYFEKLDSFASSIASSQQKELIESLAMPRLRDEYWTFFAADSPDSQLIKPDDYKFRPTFIHSPCWISILCSKLNLNPPTFSNDESASRDVMPTTSIGKRRFILGFMSTLLPSCGSANTSVRKLSCVALIRCCLKERSILYDKAMTLLELASKQMIINQNLTYQWSALTILTLLIRLKIPEISRSLMTFNIDQVVGTIYNTPSPFVKSAAFDFLLVSLLAFPSCIFYKLEEIRDIARASVVDKNETLSNLASIVYLLVFRYVGDVAKHEFQDYLTNELYTLYEQNSSSIISDPWLSKLDTLELTRVKCINLKALGMLNNPASAFLNCQNLLKHLSHSDPLVRAAALSAIFQMIPNLDTSQASVILWIILPLYADPIKKVRLVFIQFLRNIPFLHDSIAKVIMKSFEDDLQKPVLKLADIPQIDEISLVPKDIADISFELIELISAPPLDVLPLEDDGFYFPVVSEKLMNRLQVLSQALSGNVPDRNTSEVIFYLQDLKNNSPHPIGAILVLSQFAAIHETATQEISDLLMNEVSKDLTLEHKSVIEACMIGLKVICENSPRYFKLILGKMLALPAIKEGEILTLTLMAKSIREQCVDKVTEIVQKICPMINSDRIPHQKRSNLIVTLVEMVIDSNEEDQLSVFEAIFSFLENNGDVNLHYQVIDSLADLFSKTDIASRTALPRKLIEIARREIESNDPQRRLRSLDSFSVFSRILAPHERNLFILLYLADSCEEVQQKAKVVLNGMGIFDQIANKLGPAMQDASNKKALPLQVSTKNDTYDISIIPGFINDSFNLKYYNSERRKRFAKFYGLNETLFQRSTLPQTVGVIQSILNRYRVAVFNVGQERNNKISEVKTATVLHEVLLSNQAVGNELVSALLEIVDSNIREGTNFRDNDGKTMDSDQLSSGNLIHQLSVISNFIVAFDGIEGSQTYDWVRQMQELINFCSDEASSIREYLFTRLEDSFFFCSEFVDVPIFDDEQYDSIKSIRQLNQEASLEIVKTGRTDKLAKLEERTNELTSAIDTKTERLSTLNVASLNILSVLSKYISQTKDTDEKRLVDYFDFLSKFLKNEHRGLRIVAIDGLSLYLSSQLGDTGSQKAGFKPFLHERLETFMKELISISIQEGHRERADLLCLSAQLCTFVSDPKMISQIITVLIDGWRDIDSNVRKTGIKMIQYIGSLGIPLQDYQPRLCSEASELISTPEYPDKAILQDFILWNAQRNQPLSA